MCAVGRTLGETPVRLLGGVLAPAQPRVSAVSAVRRSDAILFASGLAMYKAWEPWLPGVSDLSFGSWLLGSVELALFGLYAGALLVGLTRLVAPKEEAAGRIAEVRR